MDSCDIGIHLDDDCHKTSYTRQIGLKNLSEFSEDERSIFLCRSGLKGSVADSENLRICFHHEEKWGSIFEKKISTGALRLWTFLQ